LRDLTDQELASLILLVDKKIIETENTINTYNESKAAYTDVADKYIKPNVEYYKKLKLKLEKIKNTDKTRDIL
jgi:hypothetical protein